MPANGFYPKDINDRMFWATSFEHLHQYTHQAA